MIREINPEIDALEIKSSLVSEEAFAAVKAADWVFGCLDEDGPRAILNELCVAYARPLIDLASDVPESGVYGGRVCLVSDGAACLQCLELLDQNDVRNYLEADAEQAARASTYGVAKEALVQTGPSVSPANGVIASLAAAEFMVAVTGMRSATRWIEYRGHDSKVVVVTDEPQSGCYYCKTIRGKPTEVDVERFLRMPQLRERRRP